MPFFNTVMWNNLFGLLQVRKATADDGRRPARVTSLHFWRDSLLFSRGQHGCAQPHLGGGMHVRLARTPLPMGRRGADSPCAWPFPRLQAVQLGWVDRERPRQPGALPLVRRRDVAGLRPGRLVRHSGARLPPLYCAERAARGSRRCKVLSSSCPRSCGADICRFHGHLSTFRYRNSLIRHATSASPRGPYTAREVVLPAFSHEPVGGYSLWWGIYFWGFSFGICHICTASRASVMQPPCDRPTGSRAF